MCVGQRPRVTDITDGRVAAIWLAAMFCDVLDGMDGEKARCRRPDRRMQLDSLADLWLRVGWRQHFVVIQT